MLLFFHNLHFFFISYIYIIMLHSKNQSQKYLALNYYYIKTNIFNKYFYIEILHNYLLLFNRYSFNLVLISNV